VRNERAAIATPICKPFARPSLLFKTIDVQQAESHSDFHRVPDDLTLAEAASILSGQTVVADDR